MLLLLLLIFIVFKSSAYFLYNTAIFSNNSDIDGIKDLIVFWIFCISLVFGISTCCLDDTFVNTSENSFISSFETVFNSSIISL